LNNEFEMKDFGAVRKILEIEISKQYNLKHLYLS